MKAQTIGNCEKKLKFSLNDLKSSQFLLQVLKITVFSYQKFENVKHKLTSLSVPENTII